RRRDDGCSLRRQCDGRNLSSEGTEEREVPRPRDDCAHEPGRRAAVTARSGGKDSVQQTRPRQRIPPPSLILCDRTWWVSVRSFAAPSLEETARARTSNKLSPIGFSQGLPRIRQDLRFRWLRSL